MAAPATGSVGVLTDKGDILVHDGTNVERLPAGPSGSALVSDPTSATGLAYTTGPVAAPALQSDVIPLPTTPGLGSQTTRADQTLLEGGMYWLPQSAYVNRLVFRITALAGAPTTAIAFGVYQASGGGEGVATKIGSVPSYAPAATGNHEASFSEGSILIQNGFFYILMGRQSVAGSYSIRAYTLQPYDLLNQNMPAVYPRPVSFTTALSSAAALPATFDPRVSPTGAAIPSALDLMPVLRMRHT